MLGRILNGLELWYLIKSWLIGIFLYATLIYFRNEFPEINFINHIYLILCTILFPFSKMILDELRKSIDEDYKELFFIIFTRLKIIINLLSIVLFWIFTPFVIIIGIIYIFIRDVA